MSFCVTLADDFIFFFKVESKFASKLKAILGKYCLASGQAVIMPKSSMFFSSNTYKSTREQICQIFGIVPELKPEKYLGLPTMRRKSKKELLGYIKNRILGKIQGWKHQLLSEATEKILIKVVDTAVPTYAMSCSNFRRVGEGR